MSEQQSPVQPVYTYEKKPGLFATKIPSAVVLGIGVLLFFLPFIDIRCNGMSLATVSGVQLATGYEIKTGSNSLMDNLPGDGKTSSAKEKRDMNPLALGGLLLGVLSLIVALVMKKSVVGVITSVLAAAALIGLMVDVKSQVNKELKLPDAQAVSEGNDFFGLNKLGQEVGDKMSITVEFTPWFYIAVAAFLVGAFFCYKRWKTPNE